MNVCDVFSVCVSMCTWGVCVFKSPVIRVSDVCCV